MEQLVTPKKIYVPLDTDVAREKEPKQHFCWSWSNSEKKITCFGTRHEFGDGQMAKIIKNKIRETKPDLVVVEGARGAPLNDPEFIKESPGNFGFDIDDENHKESESLVTVRAGWEVGADVLCPEPTDIEEFVGLIELSSRVEAAAFLTLRPLYAYKKLSKDKLSQQEYYEQQLVRNNKALQSAGVEAVSSQEILDMYQQWFGKSIFELTEEEQYHFVWPVKSPAEWKRSNDLSRMSGDVRDKIIVNKLAEWSQKYSNIFVVYGKSHIPRWDDVLSEVYGASHVDVPLE
jgi:hypothetical protein